LWNEQYNIQRADIRTPTMLQGVDVAEQRRKARRKGEPPREKKWLQGEGPRFYMPHRSRLCRLDGVRREKMCEQRHRKRVNLLGHSVTEASD